MAACSSIAGVLWPEGSVEVSVPSLVAPEPRSIRTTSEASSFFNGWWKGVDRFADFKTAKDHARAFEASISFNRLWRGEVSSADFKTALRGTTLKHTTSFFTAVDSI